MDWILPLSPILRFAAFYCALHHHKFTMSFLLSSKLRHATLLQATVILSSSASAAAAAKPSLLPLYCSLAKNVLCSYIWYYYYQYTLVPSCLQAMAMAAGVHGGGSGRLVVLRSGLGRARGTKLMPELLGFFSMFSWLQFSEFSISGSGLELWL
uniref:Uncharacterized protein n=1 Tax=Oryza meridionalis TaxID=40149 RepID=A0A0E0EKS5_9ORYZ